MAPLVISSKEGNIFFTEVKLDFAECTKDIHLKYHNIRNRKLLAFGTKLFCKFRIDKAFSKKKGIYCFAINNKIVYIGRCIDNFGKRINAGYGNISPRNCYEGGQSTNCRINSYIEEHKNEIRFGIYDMTNEANAEICSLEKQLLDLHGSDLEWNIQKK